MTQEVLPSLSSLATSVIVGSIYEHYKGLRYKILGVGRHSETLEELIIYQALYGENDIWVRPLEMFFEATTVNGKSRLRFQRVEQAL